MFGYDIMYPDVLVVETDIIIMFNFCTMNLKLFFEKYQNCKSLQKYKWRKECWKFFFCPVKIKSFFIQNILNCLLKKKLKKVTKIEEHDNSFFFYDNPVGSYNLFCVMMF